jgi:hypothetical protein
MKNKYLNIRPNYQVVYDALRSCCVNIFEKHKISFERGGAIGFYRCDDSIEHLQDRMQLRMFPIDEQVACGFLPEKEDIIKPILRAINEKKPYKYLDHLLHFRQNYHTEHHFEIAFRNASSIVTHDKHNNHIVFDGQQHKWDDIARDLEKYSQKSRIYEKYAKQLDHLIFKSGMDKILVVPIPVLSTPSILFFFNYEDFQELTENAREVFIVDLIDQASEVVSFYLYNRLIIEFTRIVKLETIASETELFEHFVRIISQILLPVSYTIDQNKTKAFFDWFGESSKDTNRFRIDFSSYTDENHQAEEVFSHNVEFEIPDFKIPVLSNQQGRKNHYCFIRDTTEYKIRLERIKFSLQNIYRLIFNNWKALQRERNFVQENITPLISTLQATDFNQLHQTMTDAKNEIGRLIRLVGNLQKGSYRDDYELKQGSDNTWLFCFAGEEIYRGNEIGFETLHQILLNNGKKFDWDKCRHYQTRIQEMQPAQEHYDQDIISKNEMLDHLRSARDLYSVIYRFLKDRESGKIQQLIHEDTGFLTTLYSQKQHLDAYQSIAIKFNIQPDKEFEKLRAKSKELISICQENNKTGWEKVKKDMRDTGMTTSGKKTNEQRAQETVCKSLVNVLQKLIEHKTHGESIRKHFTEGNLLRQPEDNRPKISVATRNLRYNNPDPENIKWSL